MDLAKEKVNTYGYTEKTLVSDILRELINLGFGKNNKIIKVNDLEKLNNKNVKLVIFINLVLKMLVLLIRIMIIMKIKLTNNL